MAKSAEQAMASDGAAGDLPRLQKGGRNLSNEVHNLTGMIKDLEDQLDRMIATNDALNKDLEDERARRVELERAVEELNERLRREDEETAAKDSLRAEISHLNNERTRLAALGRELKQQLADAEQDKRKHEGIVKRLRAARDDALEEVESVESQFERAMKMVADLKAQLLVLAEERDALSGRVKMSEDKLGRLEQERDALSSEVDESRFALDEIRRSLADVCVSSTEALHEEVGGDTSGAPARADRTEGGPSA